MNYASHGANTNGPVYKNPTERAHIVTANVLETGMDEVREVPTSVDAGGNEVLTQQPIRMIRNEWYRFGNDIRTMPEHKDKVTVLSLYDPRDFTTSMLAPQYRRKGGNMYTYLFKVGNGMTHYLPAGHDNLEIMGEDGFDGGVGDWDRYFAQVLFFLAGYDETPCNESCNGLPVVTAENHLTGTTFTGGTSIRDGYRLLPDKVDMHESRLEFSLAAPADYRAQILDITGKSVMQASGHGRRYAFDQSALQPGVYFMRVGMPGIQAPVMRRYVLTGAR